MRGIVRFGGYVPYRRLDRAQIPAFFGTGGGRGTRAVASHDEDSTTMGLEALRVALDSGPGSGSVPRAPFDVRGLDCLWFATATPAYLDKTNAAALHAAAGLAPTTSAFDFGGSLRSGIGALAAALGPASAEKTDAPRGPTVAVVVSDLRDGLPTSSDESSGGDAAAAFVIGDGSDGFPVAADYLGGYSLTEEFLDRWRRPGERRSRTWEERFGETRYVDLGVRAFTGALESLALDTGDVARVAVTGMHGRAVSGVVKKLGVADAVVADDLSASVGQSGCAHPGLVLAAVLESASPGDIVVLLHLADGADVLAFRCTDALTGAVPARTVTSQVAAGAPLDYAKFLSWRTMVTPEPPRRPEPARVSSTAAWRSNEWKYTFTGSVDRTTGAVHLPPARVSMVGGAVDAMDPAPRSGATGTVATFTVDRLAYSPSPPIVFAVVDFDGGGRFPVELTDCDAGEIALGGRVEMTFRRLFSAEGIHDYFWKARPLRYASDAAIPAALNHDSRASPNTTSGRESTTVPPAPPGPGSKVAPPAPPGPGSKVAPPAPPGPGAGRGGR